MLELLVHTLRCRSTLMPQPARVEALLLPLQHNFGVRMLLQLRDVPQLRFYLCTRRMHEVSGD